MASKNEIASVRRKDRTKGDAWIRTFLRRALYGHLATVNKECVFLNANIFVYDDESHAIYFHTARTGRTATNVEHGGAATFSAGVMGRVLPAQTALEFSVEYASTVVFGRVYPVVESEDKERVLQLLMDKYAPHLLPGRDYHRITAAELRRTGVHRLKIEAWSGKEKVAPPDFPHAFTLASPLPPIIDTKAS